MRAEGSCGARFGCEAEKHARGRAQRWFRTTTKSSRSRRTQTRARSASSTSGSCSSAHPRPCVMLANRGGSPNRDMGPNAQRFLGRGSVSGAF